MGFWDDLTGKTAADAAAKAAADTYAKQQQAISGIQQAGTTAQREYGDIAQQYTPWIGAGTSALERLMAGVGLGGAGDQEAFTSAYRNLPGYRSGLETALQAQQRQANAAGMGNSGRALLAAGRRASDYEDQRINDYFARLMGLQGQGLQATGARVGTEGQGIGANLGAQQSAYGGAMNAAGTIGMGDIAAAQAKQAGITNLLNTAAYFGGAALGGGKMPSFGGGATGGGAPYYKPGGYGYIG